MLRSLLVAALIATASVAASQEFKSEAQPLFDNCGDPSSQGETDGITLGSRHRRPIRRLIPGPTRRRAST